MITLENPTVVPGSSEEPKSRGISRRVKAILAGGLVLGLGAAMTLAAWTDSEFAAGSFSAGSFDLQGSLVSTTFAQHATQGTAATLAFAATTMSPNTTVYAPFSLRLAANTTYGSTVTVTAVNVSGAFTGLTYHVIDSGATGCSGTSTGTDVVPAGTVLGTVPGSTTFYPRAGQPHHRRRCNQEPVLHRVGGLHPRSGFR